MEKHLDDLQVIYERVLLGKVVVFRVDQLKRVLKRMRQGRCSQVSLPSGLIILSYNGHTHSHHFVYVSMALMSVSYNAS